MKIKTACLAIGFLLFFASPAFSQIQTFPPVQRPEKPTVAPEIDYGGTRVVLPDFFKVGDVTGNIGGAKAVTLVKPVYRDEAKEAGAEGKVKVEVEIDETGSVTAAKAVSGNPLLHEAAQAAALSSKFLTPKAGDSRTKVTGYLIYNFTIEKPNWFAAVFGLFGNPYGVSPAVTKKAFAPDWTEENALIDKLAEIRRREPKPVPPKFERLSVETSNTPNSATMRGSARITPPAPPSREGDETAGKLISLLQKRLAGDPPALWQFDLHLDVMRATHLFWIPNERQNAIELLRQRAQNAPPDAPTAMVAELQKLINLFEKADRRTDVHREVNKSVSIMASAN